ncbi:hypothetical protein CEP53_013161 [Fusarium sp. AF-6]|nr:hypothetical protein CEP53_013161 [Fusarium sp. AF-6]
MSSELLSLSRLHSKSELVLQIPVFPQRLASFNFCLSVITAIPRIITSFLPPSLKVSAIRSDILSLATL